MEELRVALGEVVEITHRPHRPVRVTATLHGALARLRPALVEAARASGTLTYRQASDATGGAYPPVGMGPLLDVLVVDCERRGEPSLGPLVVRTRQGEAAHAVVGDAAAGRQECWAYWRAR